MGSIENHCDVRAAIAFIAIVIVVSVSAGAKAQGIVSPGASRSLVTSPSGQPAPGAPTPSVQSAAPVLDDSYKLGSGDKIQLTVYGEPDLSGEFFVDGSGVVQLPLIGQIKAAPLTIHDLQTAVAGKLKEGGYLKDPRVSVEVINYRPFYIIGEVNKPGEYPYVSGMNVLNAVAMAGGYTYRANDTNVYIRRNGNAQEEKDPANAITKINPGDIIRVDERFF
jgi:polysaccharide export outer membrane protein